MLYKKCALGQGKKHVVKERRCSHCYSHRQQWKPCIIFKSLSWNCTHGYFLVYLMECSQFKRHVGKLTVLGSYNYASNFQQSIVSCISNNRNKFLVKTTCIPIYDSHVSFQLCSRWSAIHPHTRLALCLSLVESTCIVIELWKKFQTDLILLQTQTPSWGIRHYACNSYSPSYVGQMSLISMMETNIDLKYTILLGWYMDI